MKTVRVALVLFPLFAPSFVAALPSALFSGSPFAQVTLFPLFSSIPSAITEKAAATLVVEPRAKSSLVVAWASAGTSTNRPCRLEKPGAAAPLAIGNSGSFTALVGAREHGEKVSFRLSCETRDTGLLIRREVEALLP